MQKRIPVISLFSGAMGLDLGLEQAGFEVVLAVECDPQAVATIKRNRPDLSVISKRIEEVSTEEILKTAGLTRGGSFIVSGGPSCQSFSTAGARRSLGDPRGGLFHHFIRVVREAQPKFFLMENVKGMLSAAIKHRPLNQRGPGFPKLTPEEELGSAFKVIVEQLKTLNYYVVFDVLNSADYGTPQCRERILFLGSREGKNIQMPAPSHAEYATQKRMPWNTLRGVIGRFSDPNPEGFKLTPTDAYYLSLVPEGGNWRDLPKDLQEKALGGAYHSWGGRSGFYRRLDWDYPSPALPTTPDAKATMLCHPTQLRPLSIREYARIQQFPDDWKFEGSLASRYRQIGNAVPVGLGAALGRAISEAWKKHNYVQPLGNVETHNTDLIRRMLARPVTMLNPMRMRDINNKKNNLAWKETGKKRRLESNQYAASYKKTNVA
jgi:DNA (cytosine-5)-methyltransferase 1